MIQTSFLDPEPQVAHARTTDPIESHEAAELTRDVKPSWETVAGVLARLNVATSGQVYATCERMGIVISDSRVRGALSEMHERKLVEKHERGGKSKLGNNAATYELTDLGRKELLE